MSGLKDKRDPIEHNFSDTVLSNEHVSIALEAFMTGRNEESFQALEQIHQRYLEQKQIQKAVRCAFWLGLMLMHVGERARSSGWFARGERLLKNEQIPRCAEEGLLAIPAALGLLHAGQISNALKHFEQAASTGEKFHDADLIALGRLGQGQALIEQGNVAAGIKLLDELMIILETEKIFPVVRGIIYCAVIETCRKVWDMSRAQEWTTALTRWCESQHDMIPFRGQCLVRRAEIIQFYGDLEKALDEIKRACELLTRGTGEPAAGEAFFRRAELLRLMGFLEEAEECYHESSKRGRNPQPGLALLRLEQGQQGTAETSLRNILLETKNQNKRAELLPAFIRILMTVGKTDEAREVVNELCEIASIINTPYLLGLSAYNRAYAFLAKGNTNEAMKQLSKSMSFWNILQFPYETAMTRELKGLVYRQLDDLDNSNVELAAARWIFGQLHASPDVERIDRLLHHTRKENTHGLTLRELQVLSHVASGKTNKSIGEELFISERTVDRHVSNILNKLGVSSRVEATAFALRNKLPDIGI